MLCNGFLKVLCKGFLKVLCKGFLKVLCKGLEIGGRGEDLRDSDA